MKRKTSIFFTILLGGVILLTAQATTGKISGIVISDMTDTPLPDITVQAISPDRGCESTGQTDKKGRFWLLGLRPGQYDIQFYFTNFETPSLIVEGVRVKAGQVTDLEKEVFPLKRVLDEQFSRKARATAIDTRSTLWSKSLDREAFQKLPRGRVFDSLSFIMPGITEEPLLAGLSVDGASGLENRFYVDGADTTSLLDGRRGQGVALDFIDEVQHVSSGLQAEYGGTLGGVLSVVTRSGGNEFHGEVLGFYNSSFLRSNYRDILSLDVNDTNAATYYSDEYFLGKQRDYRIEAGFCLGGPIVKEKLWFLGSFMPIYYQNIRTVTHSTKDAYKNETVRNWLRTEQTWNWQVKLTSQPFKNLRLSASVVDNQYSYKGDLASRNNTPNPTVSYDDYGFTYPNLSGSLGAELSIGNRFLASLRGSFFRTDKNRQRVLPPDEPCYQFLTEAPGGYYNTSNMNFSDIPAQYKRESGWRNYSRSEAAVVKKQVDEHHSVNADFTYFLRLAGEHALKAGVQYVRQGEDYDISPKNPIIFLAWNRDFIAYGNNYGRGTYGYYAVRNSNVTGPFGTYYQAYSDRWALYLQDSWTIGSRLTVNLGLRAESEYVPSYATGYPEWENKKMIEFDFGDKLAPRLGFVYDVKGDSSLKLFGSYGLYYDIFKLQMAADAFGGSKWKSAYYSLDTYEWDQIGKNNYFPGRLLWVLDYRNPDSQSYDYCQVDPDLRPMSQREWSLGIEKEVTPDLKFSARLVQKHLRYAIEDQGTMWVGGGYLLVNPGYGLSLPTTQGGKMNPAYWETPKAKREYLGLDLSLEKAFADNWMGGISYTWSRLTGNYSGLASSDYSSKYISFLESSFSSTEQKDTVPPYETRYYDIWYLAFDRYGKPIDGPLPTDRTHRFKAYGAYAFPFGLCAGLVLNAMSGTPVSTEYCLDVYGYMPENRADLGRTPFLWFANAYLEYTLKLGKNRLGINLTIDNLFDTRTATRIYPIYNQGVLSLSDQDLLDKNWSIDDLHPVLDPRYQKKMALYGSRSTEANGTSAAGAIGTPFSARLGIQFSF